MAVIVEHRDTGERYVLLGTGFGAFRASKPNWLLGSLVPDEESGEHSVVAVSTAVGAVRSVALAPVASIEPLTASMTTAPVVIIAPSSKVTLAAVTASRGKTPSASRRRSTLSSSLRSSAQSRS